MDKRKIDLDKLYQERFQSFEMEPSTATATSMLKKLKMAKTISILKWIAGGILIATSAVTITLLSLDSNKTEKQNEPIKNEIDKRNEIKPNAINQNTTKTIIKNDLNEETLELEESRNIEEKNSQIPGKTEKQSKEQMPYADVAISETEQKTSEKVSEKSFSKDELVDEQNERMKIENRKPASISFMDSKFVFLDIPETSNEFEKPNLKLKSPVQTEPKKAQKLNSKKLSSSNDPLISNQNKKAGVFQGYLDLHFAPLMWQNNANMINPDLDSSWSYSLNQNQNLSFEFGAAFQLHHQDFPLFLQLGLDYQILKEKVDFQLSRTFEDPELSYWTYDSIWDYQEVLDTFYIIVDDHQFVIDSIFTTDTVLSNVDSLYNPVKSTEERLKNYLNTYRYINIPLLFGYQFESKNKKWNYQVLAGPAVSINLKNDGYYYTKSGNFEAYSGKVSPSLVWNIYVAANINYQWKKWQFFAQPEFQYQLNESELSHQIPRRKYQLYKLKFGIRYQLF